MSPLNFAAYVIFALTLIVHGCFDNHQLRRASESLTTQFTQQRDQLRAAEQLQNQLQGIAGATAELAEQGNPNAILIRDELRKQGITISPPQKP